MSEDYTQRHDGESFRVSRRGHLVTCCDCGLVHLFKPSVKNGSVYLKAWRLPKETAKRRRVIKRKVVAA